MRARARPVEDREDNCDGKIEAQIGPVLRQGGGERHPQGDRGQGVEQVDEALNDFIDCAAKVTGNAAEEHAKDGGERNADQTD